jgi:RNA polymerase sigma-70 factor (ECF subfamily)
MEIAATSPACSQGSAGQQAGDSSLRLAALMRDNVAFVWRLLIRLGLSASDADDASQQVFMILARKVVGLEPGKERAFLYGTAVRIAWRARRTLERRREELCAQVDPQHQAVPTPDQLLVQREARVTLDNLLSLLPSDIRSVFVLYELEEMSLSEIARALAIPRGTVASRLRRGRAAFQKRIRHTSRTRRVSGCESNI